MKASTVLVLGCVGLMLLTLAEGRRPRFNKDVTVTRKGKGKDGAENIEVNFGDGKAKMLEMLKNLKLDRNTKTFAFKNNGRTEVPHGRRGCYHHDKNGGAALNLCDEEVVNGVVNDDSGVMAKISSHPSFRTNHTRKEEEDKGMEERRRRSVGVLHSLNRIKREDDLTTDYALHIDLDNEMSRERRQTAGPEAEVELAFVADYKMFQHHGSVQATRDYILSVANIIGIYYKTVTYPRVEISVSSIYVFTDSSSQSWINNVVYSDGNTVESGDLLDGFSTWLASGPLDDGYDHAMLLSGLDFCSPSSDGTCGTSNSGLAWVSNACRVSGSKVYASSVSEDHGGYSRLFTQAHELGHNLGSSHDGSSNSMGGPGGASCPKSDGYIMGSPKTHHAFSSCSIAQFQYYFSQSQASCLYQTNSASTYTIPSDLPGASMTLDEQCQAGYGAESSKCSWKETDVCSSLWCTSGGNYCGSQGAAIMGTPCAGGFCYAGACVASLPGEDVSDVDGGWSAWSSYGSCSASCGGGTQTRTRTCSSPYPQGNGAQCSGSSSQTVSCGTGECPSNPCALPNVGVPSGCSDYSITITYGGVPYDCPCFFAETGTTFCAHYIRNYCCESATKVCG